MVEAVLKDLPEEWNVVVVMDWSDGFWDNMIFPSVCSMDYINK